MPKKKLLDPVYHRDVLPVKIICWLRLEIDRIYRNHEIVSFNGVPGYLASTTDSNDCCLFASSADGRRYCVPIATIFVVEHASDLFVKEALAGEDFQSLLIDIDSFVEEVKNILRRLQ